MARDIGSFFEKLTRQGRGGRRRDNPNRQPAPRSGAGGLADKLKDVLTKGRSGARTTAERVRERIPTRQSPAQRRRKELPPEGVVTIEYSPRRDNDPDPGEVVWAWVPFDEDPSQGKDRPVVIIGRRGHDLVGVPLTTKKKDHEAQVALGSGAWDPKRRQSYARIWRLTNIEASKVRREGTALDKARFEQLITAVDEYYDIRRPDPRQQDNFEYEY